MGSVTKGGRELWKGRGRSGRESWWERGGCEYWFWLLGRREICHVEALLGDLAWLIDCCEVNE